MHEAPQAPPAAELDLATALRETKLCHACVVAGERSLSRPLRWVHMVDHPDIINWVQPGQLLLTTGYHWPDEPAAERALVEALAEKGLAGVALAVPRFLSAFPATSREVAESLDFPLLEIPWDVPFSQITEEVHAWLIARQGQLIARAERIHRDLTRSALTAGSLGDIAAALSELLGRAVLFTGLDGEWLGGSRERHARPQPTPAAQQAAEAVAGSQACSLDDPAGDGQRWLACPVHIQEVRAALLWIDESGARVSELERRAAEQAALISALHLSHQRALQAQESRLGYAFVDSLLEGRFEATPAALERATLQGWEPQAAYQVCAILLNEPVPLSREGLLRRERWERRLSRYLQGIEQPPLISVSLNQLLFLLRSDVSPTALWRRLGDGESAMAVSRQVRGAVETAKGADDVARLAAALRPGELRDFESMLFNRVLEGDDDARRLFLTRIIEALDPAERGTSLRLTLAALTDHGFHLAQTARALEIHISTLRYRLERLREALGMDLDDTDVRLQLQVAMRLWALKDD
ncbi:PucR family transcriptional regulator [Salinicola endophyticus]|uniref:PucR family transcriptional regulator n=1 Tax=Salinicola endophyticus TaxID=1949083 RepID=A0ABY8FFK7_9GAMM|nr:PucR family transcriptional regulator [Salinicola endophyticus]WFF40328.1 PucR family transcriptional regulator [Salinicola endophyticus]